MIRSWDQISCILMQKNNMLRLFGIAETDGAELFVSDHAKKKK